MLYTLWDRFENTLHSEHLSKEGIIEFAQYYYQECFVDCDNDEYKEEDAPKTWDEVMEFLDCNEFEVREENQDE